MSSEETALNFLIALREHSFKQKQTLAQQFLRIPLIYPEEKGVSMKTVKQEPLKSIVKDT